MPPSAMTGTSPAPRTASTMAVTCGTPTPVTTRVVQMLPGPTPTFTASTPRRDQLARALLGGDVAAHELRVGEGLAQQSRWCRSTPSLWPCAESTTITSHAGLEQRPGPDHRLGARAHRRGHAQPAVLVLVGVGELPPLEDVLDRDEPRSTPSPSTTGSFSIRCRARIRSASSSVVPTGAVTSFSLVMASWIG